MKRLFWAKYKGWCYEEEVRVYISREEVDKETGQYFVDFGENKNLRLKEVIAGARFQMSKRPIEDALKRYSEDVKIVKARQSTERLRSSSMNADSTNNLRSAVNDQFGEWRRRKKVSERVVQPRGGKATVSR
jgi:hypothetical protein